MKKGILLASAVFAGAVLLSGCNTPPQPTTMSGYSGYQSGPNMKMHCRDGRDCHSYKASKASQAKMDKYRAESKKAAKASKNKMSKSKSESMKSAQDKAKMDKYKSESMKYKSDMQQNMQSEMKTN